MVYGAVIWSGLVVWFFVFTILVIMLLSKIVRLLEKETAPTFRARPADAALK